MESIPVQLFSTQGVMIVFIIAIVLIVVVVFVFFLLRAAISNLKVKTQNLEVSTQKQSERFAKDIQISSENAEVSLRQILLRQAEFATANTCGLFSELWGMLYAHNQELLMSQDSENAVKLLLEFALSNVAALIVKFNNENHIPDDPQSLEKYARVKSIYIYKYLQNFYASHEHLLPAGIDAWGAFTEDNNESGFTEFIYNKYYEMLLVTKEIRKQYLEALKNKSNGKDTYAKTLELLQ